MTIANFVMINSQLSAVDSHVNTISFHLRWRWYALLFLSSPNERIFKIEEVEPPKERFSQILHPKWGVSRLFWTSKSFCRFFNLRFFLYFPNTPTPFSGVCVRPFCGGSVVYAEGVREAWDDVGCVRALHIQKLIPRLGNSECIWREINMDIAPSRYMKPLATCKPTQRFWAKNGYLDIQPGSGRYTREVSESQRSIYQTMIYNAVTWEAPGWWRYAEAWTRNEPVSQSGDICIETEPIQWS